MAYIKTIDLSFREVDEGILHLYWPLFFLVSCFSLAFSSARRLLPEVTQRMLTLQLRELEQDGIVHREIYKEALPSS
jgi:hypothetical protein